MSDLRELPLSLYVHLPWCLSKCPYCDFNSHEARDGVFPEREYIDAVLRDLRFCAAALCDRKLVSVFFGGGTPSLTSVAGICAILEAIDAVTSLDNDVEITLEANPDAADAGRFAGYRGLGVNRLSVGVQSFSNDKLARLGRKHDCHAAQAAVTAARQAGFDNVNVDLMYALPQQSPEQALSDLGLAIELEPTHLSWYQLTIEPNTVFYKAPPPLPSDEQAAEIQDGGERCLSERGYRQYEVSAWSREGYECRHNLNYWQFGDYLGIGAGAHGKLSGIASGAPAQSAPSSGWITRQARLRMPDGYIRHAGTDSVIAERKALTSEDCILEFMLNALRLKSGISATCFTERTGLPLEIIRPRLEAARQDGLLHDAPGRVKPTKRGERYLNDLLQYFM